MMLRPEIKIKHKTLLSKAHYTQAKIIFSTPIMKKINAYLAMGICAAIITQPINSTAREGQISMPSILKYGKTCLGIDVKAPPLSYPKLAIEKGLNGWVIVQFDVLDGKTSNLAVAASSSSIFNESALEAARGMKFGRHLEKTGCAAPFHFLMED